MTKEELREKANDLPLLPGVYLMMDKTGQVIYVGKAKKLKNRVSQYFQDTASHNEKTRAMVSQVDHFDTIFVSSEFEALILENSLIKRHQPRYNILLKDDKGYPFIRLDTRTSYPPVHSGGKGGGGRRPVLRPLRRPPGDTSCHRGGVRGTETPHLLPAVPAGHRQGAALPEPPHRPVRRLLPSGRPGSGGVPPPHPAGGAHFLRPLPPADGGAANGDGGGGGGAEL